jgi:hypothetical protein
MNITRGPIKTAKKVGIYGPEGVGKTTFASRFPGAVFIDTEGSTRHMDVARFDPPEELSDVITQINYVISNPKQFGTLVIDTVDWLEKLLFNAVCAENKWKSIEEPGYGKGYVAAKQKMQQLLEMLDQVNKVGIHVVLICHSFIRKFEQPDEMSSYDRYMLKLNEKNISPLIKEWVDMLLFVNYKTDVVKVDGTNTKKGKGGQKRVMYTTHTAAWDAKNRFGLPDEMPFEYDQIAHLFGEAQPVEETHTEEPKPEPAPVKKDAPAKVEVTDKLPETKPAKKKATMMQRPDSMKSEDTDKDEVLQTLWDLMDKAHIIDPLLIQSVVAEKEYYDVKTPIRDYDKEFIEDVLIEAWDQVNAMAQDKMEELPF